MNDKEKEFDHYINSNRGRKSYVLLSMFCVGGIGSIVAILLSNAIYISIGFGLGAIIGFIITGLLNKKKH